MRSHVGQRTSLVVVWTALIVLMCSGLLLAPAIARGQQPRAGGELTFAVAETPPSFDGHRETTFAMIHPIAPHYSTLLRFDQDHFPKVTGDVAESWTISRDGLTYTFKIRRGIKFHDGSPLTARDVKATYDKLIFPAAGVASARKASYAAVERVEAPDDATVIFRLKHPAASMLANLASPWNFIYSAEKLRQDPRWYERNIMGSGPFRFVEYVPGSHWVGKKNPDYFMPGRPYLDGYRAIFIRDTAARVAAIRGGRALIEFRGFSPAHRDDLVRALGNRIMVQESPWTCNLTVAINNEKRPFADARVRRALTLAIDRWGGSAALSRISIMKPVGGLFRPESEFAAPEAELTKLAGFGRDIAAARREARRLLREAGVPEGFAFTLKNRNIKEPYEAAGVYVIDQWRQVGLNVTHLPQEGGPYFTDLRAGNFEASIDFACDFMDEPDIQLFKFVSSDKSPINYARSKDPVLDGLYERQSRATDPGERLRLLRQFEKRVLDEQAYQFHVLWWQRTVPHHARVKGWKIIPNHYANQDLRDVWLAPE
ncbi:MAG: ABC transporter substrate-binding protein [Deltaproteobacteria bacterium]|nr:ABC transporter substrate-binding protein [Deltaproteobacteria bacterium]